MSLPVVLRAEAEAEFDEAFDFYEARRPGTGVKFADQVQKTLDRIGANPDRHRLVFADIRKVVVPRFPFALFYRADASRVEVLAIFHSSRDPSIWKGRV